MFKKETDYTWWLVALSILIVILLAVGPKRMNRYFNSWLAGSYGADWYVALYTVDGVKTWKLENKSVGNETQSDGIFFITNNGHVVHISGHYAYIQVHGKKWAEAKSLLGIK